MYHARFFNFIGVDVFNIEFSAVKDRSHKFTFEAL